MYSATCEICAPSQKPTTVGEGDGTGGGKENGKSCAMKPTNWTNASCSTRLRDDGEGEHEGTSESRQSASRGGGTAPQGPRRGTRCLARPARVFCCRS